MIPSFHLSAIAALTLLATFNSVPPATSSIAEPYVVPFGQDCDIAGPTSLCEAQSGQYNSVFPGTNYQWSFPANTAGAFLCGPNGQQSVCVNTTQAGSFTLRLDYVLSSGPKFCTYVVTVNPALSISALVPQVGCPGESASFSTVVLAGNGPNTFSWTVDTGSGPVAIPGATTGTLLIPSITPADFGTYCVTVTGQCGPDSSCATLSLGKCGGGGKSFCTLTQGAYGSAGGAGNLTQINQLIGTGLTVGKPGHSLTFPAGSGACVLLRLPANSGSTTLPAGDGSLTPPTCATNVTLKHGRFKNVLLGQTITLALNTRLDANLSDLGICETMVVQDAGGVQTQIHIASGIFDALANLGLPFTVGGVLELANRALAGQATGGASLGNVNDAVSAINEGFDECKELIDCF